MAGVEDATHPAVRDKFGRSVVDDGGSVIEEKIDLGEALRVKELKTRNWSAAFRGSSGRASTVPGLTGAQHVTSDAAVEVDTFLVASPRDTTERWVLTLSCSKSLTNGRAERASRTNMRPARKTMLTHSNAPLPAKGEARTSCRTSPSSTAAELEVGVVLWRGRETMMLPETGEEGIVFGKSGEVKWKEMVVVGRKGGLGELGGSNRAARATRGGEAGDARAWQESKSSDVSRRPS